MHQIIRKQFKERYLLSRSIIVVSASLIGSAFAYLFQLISGRYFSVSDYSTLVSLFSLTTVFSLFISVFTNATTKVVAEIKDDDYPNRVSHFFVDLSIAKLIAATCVAIILIGFSELIDTYLKVGNVTLIKIMAVSISITVLTSHIPETLQGLLRFKAYSFLNIITYFSRFLIALALIYFALNLDFVFIALSVSAVFIAILGLFLLKKNIVFKTKRFNVQNLTTLIKYSLASSMALLGISFLQNNDIILVKHMFTPIEAGIYASTSIVGRIIFFAAAPVAMVMLPICANKYKKRENYLKPFLSLLTFTVAIAGAITLVFSVWPALVIETLFGPKYLPAIAYLPQYSIFMLLLTIVNIFALFFIAVSKFKLSAFALLAGIIQIIGIHFYAKDINSVILISICSILFSFLVLVIIFVVNKIRR